MTFDPPSWDFGTVAYGDQVSKTITVTNTSGYLVQIEPGHAPDEQQTRLEGLPIANLEPGASATIGFTIRPALILRAEQPSNDQWGFDLDIGGYSGGTWGDVFSTVSYTVTGQIAPYDAGTQSVCDPGPDGDGTSFGGIPSYAAAEWTQQNYACASVVAPDAGVNCQQASDCPAYCCACPSDCAGFTTQACVLGTCAPLPVACDLTQSLGAKGPTLCPGGGARPSSVLGSLGFTVGSSAALPGSSLVVTLARNPSAACNASSATLGLSFTLPVSAASQTGIFPVGAGTSATLDDPTLGTLNAGGGYVLLTSATSEAVSGSYDLRFPGAVASEVWGTFDASICP